MKVIVGLLLAVAVCSTVGLPAQDPNADAEYVKRNQEDFKDFTGIVDTGADLPSPFDESSLGSPDSFFSGISEYVRRFRERVFGNWWNNIPTLDIGDLDPSKGNSTSVVKVIDGHRVEINNTVFTKSDDSGNAVYKVRVVNVRPLDEDDDTTTANSIITPEETETKESKESETMDNEVDNVIGTSESTTTELHELPVTTTTITPTTTLTSFLNEASETTTLKPVQEFQNGNIAETTTPKPIEEFQNGKIAHTTTPKPIEELHEVDFESIEAFGKPDEPEIASEEKFEKLELQDNHSEPKPIQSSEELFPAGLDAPHKALFKSLVLKYPSARPLETEFSEEDVDDEITSPDFPSENRGEWDSFENWHTNHETNSVDDVQSVPVDLSNDIEVNQMLADQGAPTDPDAEVLSFDPYVFHYGPTSWAHKYRRGYGRPLSDRRYISAGHMRL